VTRKNREAAIFVHRGDQFLVCRRSRDGIWNVVAGQIEDGESFADAAARELVEEAQLNAAVIDLGLPARYEVERQFQHLYAPGEYTVLIQPFVAEAPPAGSPR
jgi:8-oxo-dGTP pyrophosphatase MutT (NUDIX family)